MRNSFKLLFWAIFILLPPCAYGGRCRLVIGSLKEIPHRIAQVPERILRNIAPFRVSSLYRGLKNPPLRINPKHRDMFERVEKEFTDEMQYDNRITSDQKGQLPETLLSWKPKQKLSEYLARLKKCEGCNETEREFMAFLAKGLDNSTRQQYYSPFLEAAQSWGSPDRSRDTYSSFYRKPWYESGDSWEAALVYSWNQFGYLLKNDRSFTGKVHTKTEPIPPFDVEYQAIAPPTIFMGDSVEDNISSVKINDSWYSPNNSSVQQIWKPSFDAYNQAIDMLMEGAKNDTPPNELMIWMRGQIPRPTY